MLDKIITAILEDPETRKGLEIAISNMVENTVSNLARDNIAWRVENHLENEIAKALEPELESLIGHHRAEIRKIVGAKFD